VLLGPGNSLGGPVAQILINQQWNGLKSKQDFLGNQKNNPFVVSMGIDEQKKLVL
jgi:[acyl-carrier-protein] S-malonyltransferase